MGSPTFSDPSASALLQRALADLPDRTAIECPLVADPGGEGINEQLGADDHRQDPEDEPLTVERRLR